MTAPTPTRIALTAAWLALTLLPAAAQDAPQAAVQEVIGADLSADHPGMLASWTQSRPVYSSGRAALGAAPPAARPADWPNVARVDDMLISDDHRLIGVVVEVGGILGLGSRQVLLPPDALRPMRIGTESFFVTPMTQAEMQALPEFDTTFVLR